MVALIGFWLSISNNSFIMPYTVKDSSGGSFAKKHHLDTRTVGYLVSRKSSGGTSGGSTVSRKKGNHGGWNF